MKLFLTCFSFALLFSIIETQALEEDYISTVPPTVYEETTPSPQNMDFDTENNMFIAHEGWLNDKLIHYYKFRMFTPDTYPDIITTDSDFTDVPLQKLYIVSKSDDMFGGMGNPIIEYHTSDGGPYSDFMEVHLVEAPEDYVEDTYKSAGDVLSSGQTVTATGIILNIPVVPTGSKLQDPTQNGPATVDINPVPVWYKGQPVWTYVFEVTDQQAAAYFRSTRPEGTEDIVVTPFANAERTTAIPLWHLNQYTRGVTVGVNGGGPSPAGMRNLIHLDRPDAGYSPLWQINWVTELPINYEADQVSNFLDLKQDDGFALVSAPMFINCPNFFAVGRETNPAITNDFQTQIGLGASPSWILGALIMQADVPVFFQTQDGTELASTQTNMMGAYEFDLSTVTIPDGTTAIHVVIDDETTRMIDVVPAIGSDYITAVPPTVYEDTTPSPQNMDFDAENNMFIAHSGWYNDREIHYYKFRMYTPDTYNGLITADSNFGDVPVQKIFVTTTTGDFSGAVGNPIVEYHTSDGNEYSDFMEVYFVTVEADYVADTYRSEADLTFSGLPKEDSGIVLNIPVCPTGSKLQHPVLKGTDVAPISPVTVWYKGQEVTTYVFEVTDDSAKDHFSSTRSDPNDADYAITTVNFANADVGVFAIPLWHFNQYSRGVTDANAGGPSPDGMRNLIDLDRGDAGYSPLWHINWVTELPQNYLADELSNKDDLLEDEGFLWIPVPMFVNCPDIGPVGAEENTAMKDAFQPDIDTTLESNWIQGADTTTIMQGGVEVTIQSDTGDVLGTVETNMMGSYSYELASSDIPSGTTVMDVKVNGKVIRAINVGDGTDDSSGSAFVNGFATFLSTFVVFLL